MQKWDYNDDVHTVKCDLDATKLVPFNALDKLEELLGLLNNATPVQKFTFNLDTGNVYNSKFNFVDGRIYHQKLHFASSADTDPPVQFFNINGNFTSTELLRNPPIRTQIVALRNLYGCSKYIWEKV